MQSPGNQGASELQSALAPLARQLERLEDRTRDMITRTDLEGLRREVVARDLLEPQLSLLKAQIARLEADRIADRIAMEKQLAEITLDQASRSERLWMRLGPAIAALAFVLTLFEFLSRLKFVP